jgi:hypothetical protein
MKTPKITLATTLIALVTIGAMTLISFGAIILSWQNTAASLKTSYEMKIKANQASFDDMWKKIKQAAQVPEQKKEAFKEIFNSYASSRSTGGDNQTMTWIKESVPNVDLKVYDQLMNIITGSRDTWTMKQTELVSIARTS